MGEHQKFNGDNRTKFNIGERDSWLVKEAVFYWPCAPLESGSNRRVRTTAALAFQYKSSYFNN
jgi:hypothetical protein